MRTELRARSGASVRSVLTRTRLRHGAQRGDGDRLLVDVEPDVRKLRHGRSLRASAPRVTAADDPR